MSLSSQLPFFLLPSLELVVALLLVAGPSPAAASRAFLQEECTHVYRPNVCMKLLDHSSWAIACSDTKCLAGGILNNLCLPKAKRAREFADTTRRRSRASEAVWKVCVDSYDELVAQIESSLDEFNDGNFDEAGRILAPLDKNINDCENAFKTKPSPMTSWNHLVFDCVDVAGDFFLDMIGV